jgi:hypothetical protein
MTKTYLAMAAFMIALAPGVAAAESALADPAVAGSGYRIPEVHTPSQVTHSADDADLSLPGDGYRIPDGRSKTAPASPVMNQNGTYPSRWNQ